MLICVAVKWMYSRQEKSNSALPPSVNGSIAHSSASEREKKKWGLERSAVVRFLLSVDVCAEHRRETSLTEEPQTA